MGLRPPERKTMKIHETLAALLEEHGSAAVLDALHEACTVAADFVQGTDQTGETERAWDKAATSLKWAAQGIARAEQNEIANLADAFHVLDDMLASTEKAS